PTAVRPLAPPPAVSTHVWRRLEHVAGRGRTWVESSDPGHGRRPPGGCGTQVPGGRCQTGADIPPSVTETSMPIATPEAYADMLDQAKAGSFAYPAINITSSQTITAGLQGFAEAECDGILQVAGGGGEHASGSTLKARRAARL